MPYSTRTLIAVLLWIIAGFAAMNNVIAGAGLNDWWLPLLLALGGVGLVLYPRMRPTSAEYDHDMTELDAAIAHTQDRTDALASSSGRGDPTLQDPVDNISTDPSARLEHGGELASAPGPSISHEEEPGLSAPARQPVSTAEGQRDRVTVPAADDQPTPAEPAPAEPEAEIAQTQDRTDALAAKAPTGDPALQDPVENISTDPSATLEDAGELAAAPGPSAGEELTEPEGAAVRDAGAETSPEAEALAAEPVPITATRPDIEPVPPEEEAEPVEERPEVGTDDMDVAEKQEAIEEMGDTDAPTMPHEEEPEQPDAIEIKPAQPDDLKMIEGIGPKMAAALAAAGIDTFARLSQASEDDIRAAIRAAGMRLAPSIPTWARQAEYAAAGDWDGLKNYQSQLTAGRAPE
jgi:predicted flap endonuclease-1-like 5' DNA nuclease